MFGGSSQGVAGHWRGYLIPSSSAAILPTRRGKVYAAKMFRGYKFPDVRNRLHFNIVDLVFLGCAVYGAYCGWRRGLAVEAVGALFVMIFLLTGCGLYHWTERGLAQVSHWMGMTFGGVGLIAAWVGSFYLMKRLRRRMSEATQKKWPDETTQKRGGAAAGCLRWCVIATFFIFLGSRLPGFLHKPFTDGSFVGHVLTKVVFPVVERTRQ